MSGSLGRIERAEAAIRERGYTLRYVELCEDADTPGLPGTILGATSHERREVKVATHEVTDPVMRALVSHPRTPEERAAVLEHELRHVLEPEWDCGNRDVFGRGGRSARGGRKSGAHPAIGSDHGGP